MSRLDVDPQMLGLMREAHQEFLSAATLPTRQQRRAREREIVKLAARTAKQVRRAKR